ncbi:MFS transporter [Haloarcula salina]|uniref:MFS transporter n=1 Tax=Haloarcula salina TaxID=1429914 RepID=A0AA41KC88_9EURY|nr:MFS transporter [Haloarcula salina]MBV0902140.1 MFS transporter [Haloarcula salina]
MKSSVRLPSLSGLRRFDALALTSALWFLGKFVRYAFPPLFEQLAGVYDVSTAVLGTAFSALLFVYALMQFPSGWLADRFSSVVVIGAGATGAALGALVLAVDGPLVVLVGAMVAIGAGTGTLKTVGVRLLSRTYPAQTGRVLGVFDTFGTFAGVAAPTVALAFAARPGVVGSGWRTTFLAAGLATVAVAAAFVARVPERLSAAGAAGTDGDADVSLSSYVSLFRRWRFTAFVAVAVLFSFVFNGTVAFLPLFLTRQAGFGPGTAGLLYSALFAVSLVQLVTGEVSDRVGPLPVLAATLGLSSAALAGLIVLAGDAGSLAIGAVVATLGIGMHGYRPVRGAYLMAVIPSSVAGGSLGVVRTLLMIAGALAPAVVGVLSETAGFRPVFWGLTALLALSTALIAVLWIAGD